MSKVTEAKKNEIANYSYEKATHELFAIEGNIIDYKIAINNKKAFLKDLKLHKEDELIKEIANLRIANPEASLVELGQMLKEPIGKSGVNYRLNTIIKMSL